MKSFIIHTGPLSFSTKRKWSSKAAFSMIEVLVGMFIFTIGIASIYMLIISSINLNEYNKNYIIASNLAREQLELVKNIRDSNYKTLHKWDQINPNDPYSDLSNFFSTGSYYKIYNNYLPGANFSIKIDEIISFGEGKGELNGKMQSYNLCIDSEKRYIYCTPGNEKTKFYKYIKIEEVKYKNGANIKTMENAFKISSKVVWYIKGYHEIELDTIITDWQRL